MPLYPHFRNGGASATSSRGQKTAFTDSSRFLYILYRLVSSPIDVNVTRADCKMRIISLCPLYSTRARQRIRQTDYCPFYSGSKTSDNHLLRSRARQKDFKYRSTHYYVAQAGQDDRPSADESQQLRARMNLCYIRVQCMAAKQEYCSRLDWREHRVLARSCILHPKLIESRLALAVWP